MEAHLVIKKDYIVNTDTLIQIIHEPFNSSGSFLLTVCSDYLKKFRFDDIEQAKELLKAMKEKEEINKLKV
jgi:hypothetical protein